MKVLAGTLPESWSSLVNLQYVSMGGNDISGDLRYIKHLLLCIIVGSMVIIFKRARENLISGTLPAAWASLKKLQWMRLYENNLQGMHISTMSDCRLGLL